MPSDPKRVQAVFLAAVERSGSNERAAVLDHECRADAELRRRVEALLKANDDPASFLDRPVVNAVPEVTGAFTPDPFNGINAPEEPPSEAPGLWIGPYRLLQKIGEGGMGTVWMSEQEHPVRRRVALKVIKAGMDSSQVIARFEAERQALALMDHQNIAKVLDAGTAPQGRPYFVMELIKGVPITKFCDEHHLTPRERLELFVPVCQAVQHAHQKGVIHRDLKPSNVLVTLYDGKPVPKVIDFGVAKALHQKLTERTLFTDFGAVVGTLEYMAPEQAALSHLDVDTRSDVYSLGVLLYELLTGTTPFERKRLRSAALDEMLRIIREEEPPKPSTRLSESGDSLPSIAAARRTEPAKLSRLVRGELDWIVMRALEKDRSRRYETANGFARDIQRYLADEAVEACPPSAGYKLRKFARKHRRLLATATAFVLLLATATAVSAGLAVWALGSERAAVLARDAEAKQRAEAEQQRTEADRQRMEAERQRDDATEQRRRTRHALDDMLSQESLAFLTTQDKLLDSQRAFLERALMYYKEFAAHTTTDEEGRALVGRAQHRVGHIYDVLGKRAEAEAAFRAAVAVREELVAYYPAVPNYRRDLATSQFNLGMLLRALGRWPEAEAMYRTAVVGLEKLATEFPAVPGYRYDLAANHTSLGNLLQDLERRSEAETAYCSALAVQEKLATEFPAVPNYRRDLALTRNNLGVLYNDLRRRPDAEEQFGVARAVFEKLTTEFPAVPDYRWRLANNDYNLGLLLLDIGKWSEAEAQFRAALAVFEKLVAEFPAVPGYRNDSARSHNQLALLLKEQGKWSAAEAEYRTALAVFEKLAADSPTVPGYRNDSARSHNQLALLLKERGKWSEAEVEYRTALAVFEKLAADSPAVPGYRSDVARCHNNLGNLFTNLERWTEAEAELRSAKTLHKKLADDFPALPRYRRDLAAHHLNLGAILNHMERRSEAEAEIRTGLGVLEKLTSDFPAVPSYAVDLGGSYCNFGTVIRDRGEPAAALHWYAKAVAVLEPVHRVDPRLATAQRFRRNSHWGRALALGKLGRSAESLADWERALVLDDGTQRTALRLGRAAALACVGETTKALAEANELVATTNLTAGQLYDLACVYALTAAKLPLVDAERPAARAVELLRQAVVKGYRNIAHLLKDSDLDSLRRRDDFAALLWDLAEMTNSK